MIDIFYSQKGTPYVMASDLHKALEIGTKLSVWFPRMIEYGFDEKKDFVQQSKNVTLVQGGYNVKKDWALTLEMAKHVAMIQRSPLGKQIRDYLLNLDKRVNEGEFLNHAQIMALFDICKVMGYFSVQKYFEKEHYDKVFKTPGFNWWQERANLFGYSAEQLQEALREIGVRYKNHRQAILRIEKHELLLRILPCKSTPKFITT
jgi:phage anti-repressor protein